MRKSTIVQFALYLSAIFIFLTGSISFQKASASEDPGLPPIVQNDEKSLCGSTALNGPMPSAADVSDDMQPTPNGSHIVFRADRTYDEARELWSTPASGGNPTNLSGAFDSNTNVRDFKISSNGQYVVFSANYDNQFYYDLFVVSINGGTITELSLLPAGDRQVESYLISPDGSRVIFRADRVTDNLIELFSVPITGGAPTRISSGTFQASGDVQSFRYAGSSNRVVYFADAVTEGRNELYSVLDTGGTVSNVSPAQAAFTAITDYYISPNGQRVVYRGDYDFDTFIELYSVSVTGGTAVKLNTTIQLSSLAVSNDVKFSPDSSRVVFRGDVEENDVVELYASPITGGGMVQLNANLPTNGDVGQFEIHNSSAYVVYMADQNANDLLELFSVPITGGVTPMRLSQTTFAAQGRDVNDFKLGSIGNWVIFRADEEYNFGYDHNLYSTTILGGTIYQVSPNFNGGDVAQPGFTVPESYWYLPDINRVVFIASQVDLGDLRLFSAPITGGSYFTLNGTMVSGGEILGPVFPFNSGRVYYRADQRVAATGEVFVACEYPPAYALGDALAIFNPTSRNTSQLETILNPPAPGLYNTYYTGATHAAAQWVMGDWNNDGIETPGYYLNGAFRFTNSTSQTPTWTAIWVGPAGPPVAGRFDAAVQNDCIGVVNSAEFPPYGTAFAMYYACDFSTSTPTIRVQWLSVLLPNSAGYTGTHQFSAHEFNADGVDSIAVRRGAFIAWTNTPPTTIASEFTLAQYFGTPYAGGEGTFVAGDWDNNNIGSFGVAYADGTFYYRNDIDWNSGNYVLQQVGQPVGTPVQYISWEPFPNGAPPASGGLAIAVPDSEVAVTQQVTTRVVQSDEQIVAREGAWSVQQTTSANGGSYVYASTPDDALTLEFEGTAVEIIFVSHSAFGMFTVLVDDVAVRTITTTGETAAYGQSTRIDYLTPGPHTLKIVPVKGTVAVDAFIVTLPLE